jgi:uncharacterized protein YbbK (DUF523 family)
MRELRGVSACLLGISCRYDGSGHPHPDVLSEAERRCWVPFCPEQLGGLPTPRPPAQIVGGGGEEVLSGVARVINEEGCDVTPSFLRGAQETLILCQRLGVREVWLKSRSPSCGVGLIYRGPRLVEGDGVTAALLRQNGVLVRACPD